MSALLSGHEIYLSYLIKTAKYPHFVIQCRRTRVKYFSVVFVSEVDIIIDFA